MEALALAAIFLAAVALQAWLFSRWLPVRLNYECKFSVSEAHEGDDIFLVETVYNGKILPIPWLKVDIHSSRWLDFAESHSVIAQDDRRVTSGFFLRSYQKTVRKWRLKCLKRGIFNIKNATLIWGDLLGINANSIPVGINASLVVYPGILELEELFVPANRLQGDAIVKRWIIDDPFIVSGAREYSPGDPMNKIHWKIAAREGRLMVKRNEFTSCHSLAVVLNIQSIEFEYKDVVDKDIVELGIKVAATVLDRALRMGSPVRLATNGVTVYERNHPVFTGKSSDREHVGGLLKILASLELMNVRDFEDFLDEISRNIQNEDVIIITCYLNEKICEISRRLKTSGNTVKMVLLNQFTDTESLPKDMDVYIPCKGA